MDKYTLIIFVILFLMLFCNKKVRLSSVIKKQLFVFRNDRTNKISIWDICCFIVFPIIISFISVFQLDFIIKTSLAELLTNVFSIIFTVVFGFSTIMIDKLYCKITIDRQIATEAFASLIFTNILSLIAAILSICLTQIESTECVKMLSFVVLTISLIIIMLVMMVTKRTYTLYSGD